MKWQRWQGIFMAILKHIASKNADYGEAQRYLIFRYDEYTGTPVLDKNGKMQLREEYYLDGINCDPFTFDMECRELNAHFGKNLQYDEIKSHHYIISFDPKDREENGLTRERAQQLGMEYAKKSFPGHQALVCTHMDGHNGSGNIHVHIVINSLRKDDVKQQDFMERPCDSRAGYKHHLTNDYLVYLKQSLMDLCQRENLYQVDLLTKAERKVTEKEYHARRSGQKKLDERNRRMLADGVTPRNTVFQTQKEYLRTSIEEAADLAQNLEEFEKILSEKYRIEFKISRGRFSYLHPDRDKPISGRSLGTRYEKDSILELIAANVKPEKTFETATENDAAFATFTKSHLRLITDLQRCIKAQESQAYAKKVKLTNLQKMVNTLVYVQEHGYDTMEKLESRYSEIKALETSSRTELRDIQKRLREVNEQIHFTGQYLANKSAHAQFLKAKDKESFRQEHSFELLLYEDAVRFLKEKSGDGKLPSMKLLKAEKEKLLEQQKNAQEKYRYYRDYQKELYTVRSNIDNILGQTHSRQAQKQKEQEI